MGTFPVIVMALAAGTASSTDFGVRAAPGATSFVPYRADAPAEIPLTLGKSPGLNGAAAVGARWGRVTSTWRSPAHNRRVGGVRNSFHLSGRAIDIARHRHVSHAQIEADLRRQGYYLIESLDEGDHSHFSFSFSGPLRPAAHASKRSGGGGNTTWRIVSAQR